MGVAILHPQDCLKNSSSLPKMKVLKSPPNANPKANRSNRNLPNRSKRSPLRPHNESHPTRSPSSCTVRPQVNKPVMGQVKILKRGETLPDTAAPAPAADVFKKADRRKSDLGSTDRLGPNPELVPVDRVAGFYAGSSMFVASPPPSSVPLPAFFTKKTVTDATSDLRRILRLDL